MVSEARRLFGPRPIPGGAGLDGMRGPVARAGVPIYLPAGGRRCPGTNDAGPATIAPDSGSDGFVEGTVRDEHTGVAIPGAFLQMIGTPYVTFADGTGRFRLVFGAGLVDACRTQLVRVTAQAHRARTMILSLGHADNTVMLPARR